MKKGTSTPLNKVIARGAFGAQLNFWRQRMGGADIADVYYPVFLINGKESVEYPEYKPGEKVRLRIINGSASTQFWMTFGGESPMLVSADGNDVVPIAHSKTFIGVAETYDFIVTVPQDGKIEFRAMAQDGSGAAAAYIGNGEILPAEVIAKPDKIKMMQQMAKMDMKMGAHALKFQPKKDERYQMKEEYGMQMDGMEMDGMKGMKMDDKKMNMKMPKDSTKNEKMKHGKMKMDGMRGMKMGDEKMNMKMPKESTKNEKMKMENMKGMKRDDEKMDMGQAKMDNGKMKMETTEMKSDSMHMDHSKMKDMEEDGKQMDGMHLPAGQAGMDGMDPPTGRAGMFSEYNYDYLKSPKKTSFDKNLPVNEILLNLTGNMQRYIWSINGVPLSEAENIKIKSGEVTRMTFNNLTMMHHPMHLHGHFFRVINKNGEYSPLKHTVNVAPMQQVTIEFSGNDGNESGDWFFHCHILYHMMSGMARIVSYETPRDPRMAKYPVKNLINEADQYYSWSTVDVASHMTEFNYVASNIRNQFNVSAEYGWNKNLEAEVTYERYLHDYLRVFGGVNVENEIDNSLNEITTTAIAGVRFLTPYLFNLDVRVDSKLRPQISLSREILIFPRTAIFGMYEYQADFGLVDDLPLGDNFTKEVTWNAGVEYFLSRDFSLMASYDNRFGAGGGLSIRF